MFRFLLDDFSIASEYLVSSKLSEFTTHTSSDVNTQQRTAL